MTEPMTPADCDLRDYVWMPLDCNRLLTSETWVLGSAEEKVAALTLWMKSWHQVPAGSLPNNDKMLAHISEAGARWSKVRDHALRGWVLCDDGRLYHAVVAEKARESWEHKQAQKARTEAARAAKAARRNALSEGPQKDATTSVTDSVTEIATGSTRPDQTRPDLKKEIDQSFLNPREADAERASPEAEAEPSWPPKPHPSAVTAAVEVLAAKLEGRHRSTRLPGPVMPQRTVDEQLAVLAAEQSVKPNYAPPDLLAEARARLMARGVGL